MRKLALGLALLVAVAWTAPASAALVAVDVVLEYQALDIGERAVWGVWVRTSGELRVTSLAVFIDTIHLDALELDFTNPGVDPLYSIIELDAVGDSRAYLFANGAPGVPLAGANSSGRVATLMGHPRVDPPEVIVFPDLQLIDEAFGGDSIYVTNTLGVPQSVLSFSGPDANDCAFEPCEIPAAPLTGIRWLFVVPEPSALLLAVAAALAFLMRRAYGGLSKTTFLP